MQDALTQHQLQELHQKELEHLYNKNQLLPRIRSVFNEYTDFKFRDYCKAKNIPPDFGIECLTQMALHKRATLPIMVGCLQSMAESPQECADLLYLCAEADLMDWIPDLQQFVVIFTISAEVQEELDRFQFPLPMVVPPKLVKNNKENGYLTSKGSIILRNNHHMDDVCLDHINRVNAMRLTINHEVARMVKNKWRNLDKPKEGEAKQDFERRRRAFEKYDRTAKDVIKLLQQNGSDFYLTHKFDKRGRTYCQGYHVTYQGAAWNKAVIEFANQEVIE